MGVAVDDDLRLRKGGVQLVGGGRTELVAVGDDDVKAVEAEPCDLGKPLADFPAVGVPLDGGDRGDRLELRQQPRPPDIPSVEDVVHAFERSNTSGRSSPWVSEIIPSRMLALPRRRDPDVQPELVEDALHHEIHQLVHSRRTVVEPRRGREDDRAGFAPRRSGSEGGPARAASPAEPRMSRRRSLSVTSAARSTSERLLPCATADGAHRAGADHHPLRAREPEAGSAPRSSVGERRHRVQSPPVAARSCVDCPIPLSSASSRRPWRRRSATSAPVLGQHPRRRTAYGAPEAPVIPRTSGLPSEPAAHAGRCRPRRVLSRPLPVGSHTTLSITQTRRP